MTGRREDWQPDDFAVRQWARHVARLHRNFRMHERDDEEPALRLVLQAQDVARFLTVCDGDGFVAAGLRFRLLGMDAPEIDQICHGANGHEWPCGKRARRRLFELLSGRTLELRVYGMDCYGRCLCVCLADGEDVVEVMVREGLSVAFRAQRYKDVEQEAVRRRRGMWAGAFEEPAAWRRAEREETSDSKAASSSSCAGAHAAVAANAVSRDRVRRKRHVQPARTARPVEVIYKKTRMRKKAEVGTTGRTPTSTPRHTLPSWHKLQSGLAEILAQLSHRPA